MVLGKAWSSLPVAAAPSSRSGGAADVPPTPQNPTALLVSELSALLVGLPRGSVAVAASDVLLGLPRGISFDFRPSSSNRSSSDSVIGLAVPAPLRTAKNHGVYVLEPYEEHVRDDDRLNLSEHDGGEESHADCSNGGACGACCACRPSHGGNDELCKKRKAVVLGAETTTCTFHAQEGIGDQMVLRPRAVTRFLQKPSPEVMKSTHHCTFGDDLSYEGGDPNGSVSAGINSSAETADQTEQECAWIDTGVVVFLPEAAAQLRALARGALRCCTHRGLQAMYNKEDAVSGSGSTMEEYAKRHTVKVELYTHLMMALSTSPTAGAVASEDGKTQGEGLQAFVNEHTTSKISPSLLTEIYARLSTLPFRAAAVPAGRFVHLGTTSELLEFLICGSKTRIDGNSTPPRDEALSALEVDAGRKSLGHKIGLRGRFNSFALGVEPGRHDNIILSSVIVSLDRAPTGRIGSGTVVEHSCLRCPHLVIGNNCLVSGIRGTSTEPVLIPDGMCLQMMPLHSDWASSVSDGGANGSFTAKTDASAKNYVFMYMSVEDPIKAASRIYGLPIDRFLKLTGLEESALWDASIEKDKRMLWNARIHPVLRLEGPADDPNNLRLTVQPLRWITSLISLGLGDYNDGDDDNNNNNNHHHLTSSEEIEASLDLWKSLPRLSLSEVRNLADPESEFRFRASVNDFGVADAKSRHLIAIREIMTAREHVQTDFRYAVDSFASLGSVEGDVSEALACLDNITLTSMKNGDLDIVGRAFMVIGRLLDDLGSTICNRVGADDRNLTQDEQWKAQIDTMRFTKHSGSYQDSRVDAVRRLIALRNQAFSSSSLCTKLFHFLSTQYEQSAFALTEVCVRSSASAEADNDNDTETATPANQPLAAGAWAVATAPARIDLQGGWSDTPPISYEHGGAVAGLAVRVDGKRPLSARCRIVVTARGITLKSEGRDLRTGECHPHGTSTTIISPEKVETCVLSKVSDLSDFRNPTSSCALLKCALILLGLVPLVEVRPGNNEDLQPHINKFCQSGAKDVGLEIASTSLLPKGSGLGTSSILGGCVLASIERCVGTKIANENIVDAVLALEQMLTTGGGWQDQVNGLVGGLKVGTSAQAIPLRTSITRIALGQDVREVLNRRVLLAFTGQPRLAKNILVNVLRRWGQRTDEITKTVEELVAGAMEASDAAQASNIDKVGECLHRYWQLKKVMAGLDSGVEPRVVADVLNTLKRRDVIVGGSLCGAGGGGFMAVITRDGVGLEEIKNIVDSTVLKVNKDVSLFSWHKATVDEVGLVVQVVDGESMANDFELKWHE